MIIERISMSVSWLLKSSWIRIQASDCVTSAAWVLLWYGFLLYASSMSCDKQACLTHTADNAFVSCQRSSEPSIKHDPSLVWFWALYFCRCCHGSIISQCLGCTIARSSHKKGKTRSQDLTFRKETIFPLSRCSLPTRSKWSMRATHIHWSGSSLESLATLKTSNCVQLSSCIRTVK